MGDQWEQGKKCYKEGGMGNENGAIEFKQCGGDLWIGGEKGPMGWGTNEIGDQWNGRCVGANWGTNEMGDQWDGGPLGLAENGWTNEKGDQWEGGPMSSNYVVAPTYELGDLWGGDQWDGGPMRWGINESGGPMRWGTNEMIGAWVLMGGSMRWGINEMGDQWDGEPMRWGTNEMGDQWCAPVRTVYPE